MTAPATTISPTLMDQIKNFWKTFDLKTLSEKIGGSSAQAVEAILYFGISFGVGFLFKRYFKILFISSIIAGVLVFALSYNNMLTIDWAAIKSFSGFAPDADIHSIVKLLGSQVIDWVKGNVITAVATSVGFLLGYMLG